MLRNTFDLHYAMIGLENQLSVFLRAADFYTGFTVYEKHCCGTHWLHLNQMLLMSNGHHGIFTRNEKKKVNLFLGFATGIWHNPACSATERENIARMLKFCMLEVAWSYNTFQCRIKVLISLCRCTGWSAHLLFA